MATGFHLTSRSSVPLGEKWRNAVRRASRERLPLEVSLSYPVLGRGVVSFFHYRFHREDGTISLVSHLVARLPSVEIVQFEIVDKTPLFPGLPNTVTATPAPMHVAVEDSLFESYELLLNRYPDRTAGALGRQWIEALELLTPVPLMPYYKALNPDFFAWCHGARG